MSISSPRYMLDTNVFNRVLDNHLAVDDFRSVPLVTTHVQADELRNTGTTARKNALLAIFEEIAPEATPTRSAVFDVSRWDEACWSDEDGVFEKMLCRLKELDDASIKKKKKKKPKEFNQERDILMAETAMKNELTLVSNDENLRLVTTEFGGNAITLEGLPAKIRDPIAC